MPRTEVAVVGAGPAGIAAALAASRAGAAVTLIDEYPRPGGQFFRQPPEGFEGGGWFASPAAQARSQKLLGQLAVAPVELRTGTLVWGVEDGRTILLYREGGDAETLRAEAIVVATGAYDRPVAFPGWTLPGVWSAGGAQAMLKGQHVLPGRRVLVAGAGPLLLPLSKGLVEAGATVVGVVEATTRQEWALRAHRMWGHWDRMRDAIVHERALLAARLPRYFGHVVVRAEGEESVQRVIVAAVDSLWRPVTRSEKVFDVDLLCIGYGFLSSTELPALLGCRMRYHPAQQQYLPVHGPDMESSVPGVFVAGETTGVGGAELALAEGEIAGLAAARLLGHPLNSELQREMEAARARRRHQLGFAEMLNDLFAPRPGIYQLAEPDTPLCRCEEVTVGEVRAAIRRGADSLRALKMWTRVGMGPCQGRICANLIAHLLAQETGRPLKELLQTTPRPPIKPVPLRVLGAQF
ncbi:MAG: NAD(P)/FAD-dependent oxidoreductase [Sphingomonadaceae bacterium]